MCRRQYRNRDSPSDRATHGRDYSRRIAEAELAQWLERERGIGDHDQLPGCYLRLPPRYRPENDNRGVQERPLHSLLPAPPHKALRMMTENDRSARSHRLVASRGILRFFLTLRVLVP